MQIQDQIGHEVILKSKAKFPQRIISLVPSQTELLVDLGCEEMIVGVTRFCTHPKHIRTSKQIVGGTKDIDFDLIHELTPDLIICNKEENNKEDVLSLQKLYPTYTSDVISIEDALNMINDIATMIGKLNSGNTLIKSINNDFLQLKNRFSGTVAYLIWNDPVMLAGMNTFINSNLEFLGFTNLTTNVKDRYPLINQSDLNNKELDYIFLSSEPYPFKEKNRKQFQDQYPKTKVVLVDGRMFSWYGSRLSRVLEYFNALDKRLSS